MFDCQQALIAHLKKGFQAPVINTIDAYAGQLKDANKLTQLIPAVLVTYIDGEPIAQDGTHNFDLLVIRESRVLNKTKSMNVNLQLSSDVVNWLKVNTLFLKPGGGSYYIDPEQVTARTLLINQRFTIVDLGLKIDDRS